MSWHKIANGILALLLIALLALPMAQPPMALGSCSVITSTVVTERGVIYHLEQLCCWVNGRQYCITIDERPEA